MLRTLRIRDLAIIDELAVEFGRGLNLLTGETGAGKSIVVDALGLAAGRRADSGMVRAGRGRAVIEAVFEPADSGGVRGLLEERGLEPGDDGVLVIRREVAASGAGRVFVNGSPASVGVLRELGARLIEIHGQHEQQGLLSPEHHLDLLDRFGGHAEELRAVGEAWAAVVDAREEIERLRSQAADRRRRAEELRRDVREIDAVAPKEGERDRIDAERTRLKHAAEIGGLLDEIVSRLYEGDPSASGLAAAAARRASRLAELDPELVELADRARQAQVEIEDVGSAFRDYRDEADFDPSRLDELESRRAALDRLCLLYGPDEEAVLSHRRRAVAELGELDGIDETLAAAERGLAAAETAYRGVAARLGEARRAAAERLAPALQTQLQALAFERASFDVALAAAAASARGAERAEFLLGPNPGEPPRPLARIASGGELSRVMLALHAVLGRAAGSRVLVFDEVDAGVGGAVADAVGARLAALSAGHQVLCVTHLPQVAAHADHHYHVRKTSASGRTRAEVVPLTQSGRLDELARMLGGRRVSAASRKNAEALLAGAVRAAPRRERSKRR